MKTAISVPDETFRRVEKRAAELGMNRSEFYATAAERFLGETDDQALTQHIDEAIARGAEESAGTGLSRLADLTADDEW